MADDLRLSEALIKLGRRHAPRPGWQERVRQQIIAPRPERRGSRALIAAMAGLAVLCAALTLFLYRKSQSEAAAKADARLKASALVDYEKEVKALRQNQSEQDALLEKYRAAATEEERKKLEAEIAAKRREAYSIQARADTAKKKAGGGKASADAPPGKRPIKVNCDPNDPLCGL